MLPETDASWIGGQNAISSADEDSERLMFGICFVSFSPLFTRGLSPPAEEEEGLLNAPELREGGVADV